MEFYNGIYEENRSILESAGNGRFTNNVDDDKAWGMIEEMVVHSQQYSRWRGNSQKAQYIDSISALTAQLTALNMKIDNMQGKSVNAVGSQSKVTCGACGMLGHVSIDAGAIMNKFLNVSYIKKSSKPAVDMLPQLGCNLHK